MSYTGVATFNGVPGVSLFLWTFALDCPKKCYFALSGVLFDYQFDYHILTIKITTITL